MPVTSGKIKASVRRDTSAVSGMRVTIVHNKNRTQMPPHPPSRPCHEDEVCRRREASKGKSNPGICHSSTNRLRYCLKGTCTRSPCEHWHPPSVNFTKQKRAAKPGISVCSRIIRLMNNQTKSQIRATIPTRRRESDDKNAVAIVKIVPLLGCVSQDMEASVSQRGKQPRGNPMQKVLGPFRRKRFTQSTLRQASIREKKGPSLGKVIRDRELVRRTRRTRVPIAFLVPPPHHHSTPSVCLNKGPTR